MDKNTYETYEFLPANSTEPDADQFFVVQDDGTFLINRQVQYVAQVQDVKEALADVQPCTVYDVSSQQFFVDVDNSAELISVSDQFILPDGENGLYNNSYLLQSTSSATVEQIDEDVIPNEYKETNPTEIDMNAIHNSKLVNNCTEITLTDDQYQTLEQKGWILLETHDKIFVLDTLGLHDITSNTKLIQKLKNDIENTRAGLEAGCIKIEGVPSQFPNLVVQPLETDQQETYEFVIGNSEEQDRNTAVHNLQFVLDEKGNSQAEIIKPNLAPAVELVPKNKPIVTDTVKNDLRKQPKSLKIKTKLTFKDIADKIVLGKSINGKRIVANVVKRKIPAKVNADDETRNEHSMVYEDITENQQCNITGLYESHFVNLIQQAARGRLRGLCAPEDITSADTVVTQLLKVPNMKEAIVGQNLIITKVANNKDEHGVLHNKGRVKLVTGRVVSKDNNSEFEYMPNMLQNIRYISDNVSQKDNESEAAVKDSKNFDILHIHVTETKSSDNIERVSVTMNKRQLPINLMFDLKRRYPNTIFACGACATMFKSEDALKEHQENECLETDDMLTIDTDSNNIACSVIKGGKEKVYSCTVCDAKFLKLSNCQRHMKTHAVLNQQELESDTTKILIKQEKIPGSEVYKCKMCPSTYFHPSTLSKHIVARHINVKSN